MEDFHLRKSQDLVDEARLQKDIKELESIVGAQKTQIDELTSVINDRTADLEARAELLSQLGEKEAAQMKKSREAVEEEIRANRSMREEAEERLYHAVQVLEGLRAEQRRRLDEDFTTGTVH